MKTLFCGMMVIIVIGVCSCDGPQVDGVTTPAAEGDIEFLLTCELPPSIEDKNRACSIIQRATRIAASRFPIAIGSTVAEVRDMVVKYNGDPSHYTLIVIKESIDGQGDGYLTLNVLDPSQEGLAREFWADVGFHNGRTEDWWVTFGNLSIVLPFRTRVEGTGDYKGLFDNRDMCMCPNN